MSVTAAGGVSVFAEWKPSERFVSAPSKLPITPRNSAIAASLVVNESTVEKHVTNIFTKLDLPPADHAHRRVLAVLRWLAASEEPS